MRLFVSVDTWTARLFAVLALSPVAGCGGGVSGTGGGGTTSSAASGGGGTGGTATKTIAPCKDPQPQIIDGQPTGYVDCAGGWTHREAIMACPNKLPGPPPSCFGGTLDMCMTDANCTAQPYGRCIVTNVPTPVCSCAYGCVSDADCLPNFICECGDVIGSCVPATGCKSDAECDAGLCATYTTVPGCSSYPSYTCQSAEDECTADSDCTNAMQCTYTGTHRVCVSPTCTIGRPFLVDGEERLAAVAARGDWRAANLSPAVGDLDPASRAALAARWTKVGLMEHASIAAFARFVLQLLALGAPPDLVRDAQAAMADETRHAEVCFALASAYAGSPVGPGPLAIDRAMESKGVSEVLVTAIHEGCVGETVAAIEAAETAARAEDPAVRAALSGIAEDETRHAELAWRFVRWALARDPGLARVAEEAFAGALLPPSANVGGSEGDPRLSAHGAPSEGLRWEIRRRALSGVVAPCAQAMLASAAHDEPPTRREGQWRMAEAPV